MQRYLSATPARRQLGGPQPKAIRAGSEALDCQLGVWCRRGDSNPHGLPHTPLKRTCLPVPPLRHLERLDYQTRVTVTEPVVRLRFVYCRFEAPCPPGGLDCVGGVLSCCPAGGAGVAAPLVFAGCGAGLVAGGACSVVTGAGVVGRPLIGAGCDSAGPELSPRDFFSNNPGIENKNAIRKKAIAAVIVTFASTVCVPRGPKAVEFSPPPKTVDASDLLGCSSTNSIRIKQAVM